MKPLNIIYWSRVCFAILAAVIYVVGWKVTGLLNGFIEGLMVAIIIYALTIYVLRWRFLGKVETPSKVFTTGIGTYFITWFVAWGVFFSLLYTP